jgi:hypothetical protein
LVASEDNGGVGLGVLLGFYMGCYASVGYVFVDVDGVRVAFVKDGVPHDATLLGGAWREGGEEERERGEGRLVDKGIAGVVSSAEV